MSYKSLSLKIWISPRDVNDVRIYINSRFVEFRNPMSAADGDFLKAGQNGEIVSSFTGHRMGSKAELAALGRRAVIDLLTFNGRQNISFDELLDRVASCQTKSGRFSVSQYQAKFGH